MFEELPNALFVVQFQAEDLHAAKFRLLAAFRLGAGNVFASVNDYTLTFDPCSQIGFKQLVTVHISQGSQALFGIIQFLTAGIGRFVKDSVGADLRRMTVLVESTLKVLPGHEQFKIHGQDITTIFFVYEGINLCCCYSFSYRYVATSCRQPRPCLFSAPEIIYDVVPEAPPREQYQLQAGPAPRRQQQHRQQPRQQQGRTPHTRGPGYTPHHIGASGHRNRPKFRTPNFVGTPATRANRTAATGNAGGSSWWTSHNTNTRHSSGSAGNNTSSTPLRTAPLGKKPTQHKQESTRSIVPTTRIWEYYRQLCVSLRTAAHGPYWHVCLGPTGYSSHIWDTESF